MLIDEEWVATKSQKKKLLFLIYNHTQRRNKIGFAEICSISKLKKSTVSEHLSTLKSRGLVREVKQGRKKYYSLTPRGFILTKKIKVTQPFR
ncbi:MAG: hypothetical protein DRO07_01865 [Candidatus Iainarchaeum archaeon]|uniref:HTH arsR-type domain-containing protein n=1 Tax=Candidatus Iainarchaeum sp. TaxID=3101447 RepID=A0A497JFN2_9ARCH|nr:MAG: hypothetical protein DRO07_01865 [Candidatus Diapherotrites archaeon]